jgi:hypothetical protein
MGIGVDVEVLGIGIAQYELATLIDYRVPLARGVGPDATDWVLETIDAEHVAYQDASVAVGPDGVVHVLYATEDAAIRVAHFDGTTWSHETLATESFRSSLGATNVLRVAADGSLHAVWSDFGADALRYAHREPAGWVLETVAGGQHDVSMTLDGAGRPHVAFRDGDMHTIRHAHRDDAGWHAQLVTVDDDTVLSTNLATRPDGVVALVAQDNAGHMRFGTWDGSSWTLEDVTGSGSGRFDGGSQIGFAFRADGRALVVYDAYLASTVRLGERGPDGTWTFEDVLADGPATDYPALALSPDGTIHVLACDDRDHVLRHARRGPSGWVLELVDPSGSGCRYAAAAAGPEGTLHAVYERRLDDALRHGAWTPPGP